MKFKYLTNVDIAFKSWTYVTFICDQIQFKEGYFDRLIFLSKGIEIGSCYFYEVESIEYYESVFSTKVTYIDKFNIMGGDLVEA